MLLSLFWLIDLAKMVYGAGVYQSPQLTGACTFPLPLTKQFDIFCQMDYHKATILPNGSLPKMVFFQTNYICDPSGLLSRTEVELLDATVIKNNFSTCFCTDSCTNSNFLRLGIVLLPSVSTTSVLACESSSLEYAPSPHEAAHIFAHQLMRHWQSACSIDLLLVYIGSWQGDRPGRSFLVPLYSHHLIHLRRFSVPVLPKNTILQALQNEISHANHLMASGGHFEMVTASVPIWARWLVLILLVVVALAIYIANCITKKISGSSSRQKSSVAANRRSSTFRAGFAGGVMMGQSQHKKSVMMFRTFTKSSRNQSVRTMNGNGL